MLFFSQYRFAAMGANWHNFRILKIVSEIIVSRDYHVSTRNNCQRQIVSIIRPKITASGK